MEMQLTKNFSLAEMLRSDTATSKNYTEQFNPSDEVVMNLKNLCMNVLEPLRAAISLKMGKDTAVIVTSGYRCSRVNGSTAGSALHSQHELGMAADTHVEGMSIEDWYEFIKNSGIAVDQLIQEHGYWAHVSFSNHPIHRGDCLRATGTIAAPVYIPDGLASFKNAA